LGKEAVTPDTDKLRELAERVLNPVSECDLGDGDGPCEQCELQRELADGLLSVLNALEAAKEKRSEAGRFTQRYIDRAAIAEAERDRLAEAAKWYVQCLEDVRAGKVVRGLSEAEAGFRAALAGVPGEASQEAIDPGLTALRNWRGEQVDE
jgi:hypothetical protein